MTRIKRDEYASVSLKRILIISLMFIFILGIAVLAGNTKLNSVKIQFSNNHEITVVTSKTNVGEILKDNNIVLASNEVVFPAVEEDITDVKTIKIMLVGTEPVTIAEVLPQDVENMEDIKQQYINKTEEIITVTEEIPFETITRDVSNGDGDTANTIVQTGKNGLRETKYKVTYQDSIEIAREELDSKIIKEPRNQIVQVQTKAVTSRSSGARGVTTSSSGQYVITAYCGCAQCCGKTNGITASGVRATANHTIAAPGTFAFGTQLLINGQIYTVEDRGGAIQGNRLDIYMDSHAEAIRWGRRTVDVEILY